MVPKLEANGHKPMRFIFDFARPDLTKLDKMFGMVASGTTNFDDEIRQKSSSWMSSWVVLGPSSFIWLHALSS
ncbi:hypothetical protein DPMN_145995 [Dreissena polymorpha]|uniref:Uncharacterized protein n=1 Tax=Dreissena polymorpha TaxID=45954 RepID=A0A9D4J1P6_DREPO|nr:hypothetical protein DPMN_145995 [Dreissena polymorpha]